MAERLMVKKRAQSMCVHHKDLKVSLFCENCVELVCVRCVSTVHRSHTLDDLENIISRKKQDLNRRIENMQQTGLVQLQLDIDRVEEKLINNNTQFDKLSTEIKENGDRLKKEVDVLTEKSLSWCKKLQEENIITLNSHKCELQQRQKQIEKSLLECKETIDSGSDIEIYNTEIGEFSPTIPVRSSMLHNPTFHSNIKDHSLLEEVFGKVVLSNQHEEVQRSPKPTVKEVVQLSSQMAQQQQLCQNETLGNFDKKNTLAASCRRTTSQSEEYEIFKQCKVVAEPNISHKKLNPYEMSTTSKNSVWVCCKGSKTASLLEKSGIVKEKVKFKVIINGISVSPATGNLWASQTDNCIIEVTSPGLGLKSTWKPLNRFMALATPTCMCITQMDNILVGMHGTLALYTANGQLIHFTGKTKSGVPILCAPKTVSECPLTHNVAVVDFSSATNRRSIVIMNENLEEQCAFQPASGSQNTGPSGAKYDNIGNLVVTDINPSGSSILLLSGNGDFIKKIFTPSTSLIPSCFTIDTDNLLWVMFEEYSAENSKLKLLQYSSS